MNERERKAFTVRVMCPVCGDKRINTNDVCATCNTIGGHGWLHATLIPFAGGPVVVEKEAMGEAVSSLASLCEKNETPENMAWLQRQLIDIITPLFPDGIVVAEAVEREGGR